MGQIKVLLKEILIVIKMGQLIYILFVFFFGLLNVISNGVLKGLLKGLLKGVLIWLLNGQLKGL